MKLHNEQRAVLPSLPNDDLTCLLYIFKGNVLVNGDLNLVKKDSLLIKNHSITIEAMEGDAELVLFVTDESAAIYDCGMYSGNRA